MMNSNPRKTVNTRFIGLLVVTLVAALLYAASFALQIVSLIANEVGYDFIYRIRFVLLAATFVLACGSILWLLVPSKNRLVAVLTAFVSISSFAVGYYLLFDSQVNANRILSSEQVLKTEFKRTILLHYTTWLAPVDRLDRALSILAKDDESIHDDWDKMGFGRQMDMINLYNRKNLIAFRIRDRWLAKTIDDKVFDVDLFMSQALDPHERNDFIRAITLQTDSAKTIIEVSKWGFGGAILALLLGWISVRGNPSSEEAPGFLGIVAVMVAIAAPVVPLLFLSGITLTL